MVCKQTRWDPKTRRHSDGTRLDDTTWQHICCSLFTRASCLCISQTEPHGPMTAKGKHEFNQMRHQMSWRRRIQTHEQQEHRRPACQSELKPSLGQRTDHMLHTAPAPRAPTGRGRKHFLRDCWNIPPSSGSAQAQNAFGPWASKFLGPIECLPARNPKKKSKEHMRTGLLP